MAGASDPLLWVLLIALLLVFGVPLGFATYFWVQRKQRRRLERSNRPTRSKQEQGLHQEAAGVSTDAPPAKRAQIPTE